MLSSSSQELQQWRQAELKNDIEKIKSHELDLLARGTKYVLKSHKGEQVIEEDETAGGQQKRIAPPAAELKLPDELPEEEVPDTSEAKSQEVGGGAGKERNE